MNSMPAASRAGVEIGQARAGVSSSQFTDSDETRQGGCDFRGGEIADDELAVTTKYERIDRGAGVLFDQSRQDSAGVEIEAHRLGSS